jgi:DHA2 family lincomycin resistance protein-like MFS transporter
LSTTTPRLTAGQLTTIVILATSTFFALVTELVMGVALPTIMIELNISASTAQWLTTAYALVLAVIIPTTGYIQRRFKTRPIFLTSMALFSLGTAIAVVSPNFEVLLVGRIVQALGTATLLPLLMTTAFGMVPPERRGQMMATITAVISLSPAVAPAFSGFVMAQLGWRWLFIIVLPLALLGLIAGALKVPNVVETSSAKLDVLSLFLTAIGFGALIIGLSAMGEGSQEGIPATFWIAVPIGLLGITAFLLRQNRLQRSGAAPLMDVRIFNSRAFCASIALFALIVAGAFSQSVLLPLVLQNARGLGVFETGLFMAPGGLVIIVISVLVGKVYNRIGARTLMTAGAAIVAAGWWLMSSFGQTTPIGVMLATYLIINAGQCLAWVALFTLALDSLPEELTPHGSAALNTMQQLGGAVGLAILIGIFSFTATGDDPGSVATSAQAAFTGGGVIALIAVIVAFLAPRKPRAARPLVAKR